jgi:hypothetical protein
MTSRREHGQKEKTRYLAEGGRLDQRDMVPRPLFPIGDRTLDFAPKSLASEVTWSDMCLAGGIATRLRTRPLLCSPFRCDSDGFKVRSGLRLTAMPALLPLYSSVGNRATHACSNLRPCPSAT